MLYIKLITREILSSKARFISIMIIIFLGVASYTGLKSASPDLNQSINNFFCENNLMDSKIICNLGLNEDDLKLLENNSKVLDYMGVKSIDVNLTNMNNVVKFTEYNKNKNKINNLIITKGKLPENSGEIALDENALYINPNLKIGDTYVIKTDKNTQKSFQRKTFKIVGFVNNPIYLDRGYRGSTTVGKGSIDYFAVINSKDISMDFYTEIYVRFKNVSKLQSYSNEYKEKMEKNNDYLKKLYSKRPKERSDEVKLYKQKAKYYFFQRSDNPGYSNYECSVKSINKIAAVFSIFFFIVSSLICSTTMTRMIDEERIEIGTLKALGFRDFEVSKKFIVYASIPTLIGSFLGILVGTNIFPYIISDAYTTAFTLPDVIIKYYPSYIIESIVVSLLCTVGTTSIVLRKVLKENIYNLMRPKAPKIGKKILLEKITFLWNKLNFNQKVTCRNLFRYKKRMFMTIFGVAGAASILFAGFSVQYSISGINERQFEHIIKYDAIVALNDNLTNDEENELETLLNDEAVDSYTSVFYEEVSKTAGRNNDKQSIKLIVPENTEEFNKYISILNRKTGENMQLEDDGVVISERLSTLLNVKQGDTITYTDSTDKKREVKISGICEMYAGHFICMNENEYKNIYGEDLKTNAKLLMFKDSSLENTKNQSAKFMELSAVKGVVQNTTLYNQINTIVESLNKIMIVLIIIAVLLAIVILYNLTNINVAERIRKLCTIKVLGFYDKETTMYIYRETIILSAIGIVVGWIIGIILHNYILTVVPPDEVMFNPVIWIGAYVIPFVCISVVTFILKYYVNSKLKNVDMLEALKSVD